jgi:hypothetical protein
VDPEPQRYPLIPAPAQPLDGPDRFAGLDAAVVDFWRWACSDLRDNTVRGVLAEYLVAFALGRTDERRKNWDNYDVRSPSGVTVEVKASGYLQAWPQRRHSQPQFGSVAARRWSDDAGQMGQRARDTR